MRKKSGLLILLLILIACLGGYVGLTNYNALTEQQKTADAEAEKVYLSDLDKVVRISFQNSNGDFTFYLDGDQWYYSTDPEFPLKQSKLESIESTLKSLVAVRSFEPGDSLSAYGLDQPAYTLTAIDENGSSLTLRIGDSNGENYYAEKQDGTQIYTISNSLISSLNCSLNDLVELETFPTTGTDAITSLTITAPDYALTLEKETVEAAPETDAENAEDSVAASPASTADTTDVWYSVSPDGTRTALDTISPASGDNPTDLMNQLLDAVTNLSFQSCVSYKADNTQRTVYGMISPAMTLTVCYTQPDQDGSQTDKRYTLTIGTASGDGSSYYASMDASTAVNLLNAETVSTLNQVLSAFRT